MAGQHDRAPAGAELTDQLADLNHAGRVEAVGRLVEKDELGVAEERAGDPESLLHAERVRREFAVGAFAEIDERQEPVDIGGQAAPTDALEVTQVRAPGEVRIERWRLDHRAHEAQRGRTTSRIAEDASATGRWMHQSEQHSHGRGLPRPIGAEEAEHATTRHAQRQIVHGHDVAVAFGQRARLDDVLALIAASSRVGGPRVGGSRVRGLLDRHTATASVPTFSSNWL